MTTVSEIMVNILLGSLAFSTICWSCVGIQELIYENRRRKMEFRRLKEVADQLRK